MKSKKLVSVAIVLAMLLSLFSMSVFADGNNVAQIGETEYATLAEAVAAVEDGDTIKLLADLDFSAEEYAGYKWAGATYNPLTITKDNVTLDLDGHTISNMGNAAIVFGNLLAKDGRISNATIMNGTLLAGKTDNVTNSYVLGIAGVDGALIKNVTTNGGINAYSESKNVVIDSCNVNGTKYYTVCAQVGSDITIKGTTYTKNTDSSVATKAMFWVHGAGTGEDDIKTDANPTGAFDASSITIESGNFTVSFAEGGNFHLTTGLKPVVKGGTFNFDPTAYLAEDYEAVNNGDGTWTVSSVYAAKIGDVKYATLAEAVAAAEDGDTVKLLADITLEPQTIDGESAKYGAYITKNLTIDGDNKVITSHAARAFGVKGVSDNIDVTFKNVIINNGVNGAICICTRGGIGTLTLNNVTLNTQGCTSGYNQPLTIGGTQYTQAKVIVEDSLIQTNDEASKYYAIILWNPVDLSIKNSTIKGWACVYQKPFEDGTVDKTEVAIDNCTLISKGLKGRTNHFSAIFTEEGGFSCVVTNSIIDVTAAENTYQGVAASNGTSGFSIELGEGNNVTLTGDTAIIGYNFDDTANEISVSGGTFNVPVDTEYCADGYFPADNGNGVYGVDGPYVAKIGDVKYATLEDAVEAANAGDTIVLLNDITYDADHSVAVWGKKFNLDLNGHTFTTNSGVGKSLSNMGYTATAICFAVEGEATVSNGTIRTAYGAGVYAAGVTATLSGLDVVANTVDTQTTKEYSSAVRLTSAATVIIESGSYKGENAIAVSNSGGDVIVNGGDFDGKIFFSKNTDSGVSKSITINGGNFTGEFVNADKGILTIYGGTFDHDPTDYVADGYEAVNNGNNTWTVGKVEVGEFNETATTDGYDVTYAVTKQVIDENDNNAVINTVTDCKVNVKAVTEDTVYAAETSEFFDNLDMDKVLENVVSYAADAGDTINVEIKVVCSDPEVVNETITYEVHPEAIITVNDNAPEAVRISNDALDENAVFTITLPVPEALAGNDYIKVTHRSTGYADDVQLHAVQGEPGNRYVRFDVTHFSEFELAANNLPLFAGHTISLNGYINLNFYLNLAEEQVTTGEGTVVRFAWDLGSDTYKIKTTDFVSGKGYKATVKVPAAEMTCGITATVYINEVKQAETNTYSVRQYADTILSSSPSAELENLVKAMLYYGAKAQLAFGSNLDSLANEGISYAPSATRDELLAGIDAAIAAANNGAHATNMRDFAEGIGADAYYSSSLVYLSGCTLRHYFVFVGGAPNVDDFNGVKSDYYYYVDVTDIAAADLDKLQSFPVGGNTCFYSALDFVKAIIYNYTEGYNYDLAAATYWYNQAANAYFD